MVSRVCRDHRVYRAFGVDRVIGFRGSWCLQVGL